MTRICLMVVFSGGILGALSGCGGAVIAEPIVDYGDLQPVTGKVEFNGQPISDATVTLHPVTPPVGGNLPHPPSGLVGEDGTFTISTFRDKGRGLGAPIGEYRITVSWFGSLQGLSESQIDGLKEQLPAKYQHPVKSGLTVTVAPGANELPVLSLQ